MRKRVRTDNFKGDTVLVIYQSGKAIYAATDPDKFGRELAKHAMEPAVSWGESTSKKEPVGHARPRSE